MSESDNYHPEEMKATYHLKLGERISLQGSARVTPAGIITAGITTAIILLACANLARGAVARLISQRGSASTTRLPSGSFIRTMFT